MVLLLVIIKFISTCLIFQAAFHGLNGDLPKGLDFLLSLGGLSSNLVGSPVESPLETHIVSPQGYKIVNLPREKHRQIPNYDLPPQFDVDTDNFNWMEFFILACSLVIVCFMAYIWNTYSHLQPSSRSRSALVYREIVAVVKPKCDQIRSVIQGSYARVVRFVEALNQARKFVDNFVANFPEHLDLAIRRFKELPAEAGVRLRRWIQSNLKENTGPLEWYDFQYISWLLSQESPSDRSKGSDRFHQYALYLIEGGRTFITWLYEIFRIVDQYVSSQRGMTSASAPQKPLDLDNAEKEEDPATVLPQVQNETHRWDLNGHARAMPVVSQPSYYRVPMHQSQPAYQFHKPTPCFLENRVFANFGHPRYTGSSPARLNFSRGIPQRPQTIVLEEPRLITTNSAMPRTPDVARIPRRRPVPRPRHPQWRAPPQVLEIASVCSKRRDVDSNIDIDTASAKKSCQGVSPGLEPEIVRRPRPIRGKISRQMARKGTKRVKAPWGTQTAPLIGPTTPTMDIVSEPLRDDVEMLEGVAGVADGEIVDADMDDVPDMPPPPVEADMSIDIPDLSLVDADMSDIPDLPSLPDDAEMSDVRSMPPANAAMSEQDMPQPAPRKRATGPRKAPVFLTVNFLEGETAAKPMGEVSTRTMEAAVPDATGVMSNVSVSRDTGLTHAVTTPLQKTSEPGLGKVESPPPADSDARALDAMRAFELEMEAALTQPSGQVPSAPQTPGASQQLPTFNPLGMISQLSSANSTQLSLPSEEVHWPTPDPNFDLVVQARRRNRKSVGRLLR